MAYTNKMSIQVENIPKEKFDKLRSDVIRVLYENGLNIDDDLVADVLYGFGDDVCGIHITVEE